MRFCGESLPCFDGVSHASMESTAWGEKKWDVHSLNAAGLLEKPNFEKKGYAFIESFIESPKNTYSIFDAIPKPQFHTDALQKALCEMEYFSHLAGTCTHVR